MCYEKRDPKQARACFERDQRKDDYISRKALLAEYDRVHVGPPGGARKLIEEAPAADVVPVVHGWWIHDINNLYGCSECLGRETMSPKKLKPYCPNCGARMDGE